MSIMWITMSIKKVTTYSLQHGSVDGMDSDDKECGEVTGHEEFIGGSTIEDNSK